MAIAVALNKNQLPNPTDLTQQQFIIDATLTLTGGYTTNGDPLSLAGLGIPSNQLPTKVEIWEDTPTPGPQSGWRFTYLPGTNLDNGAMEMFNGTTQATTNTYATLITVSNFSLKLRGWFPAFV